MKGGINRGAASKCQAMHVSKSYSTLYAGLERNCNTPCLLLLGPPLPRQLQGFSEKHLTIALEVGNMSKRRQGVWKAYCSKITKSSTNTNT
jgi:hypothetical protein